MRSALITGDGYSPAHLQRLRAAGYEVLHRPAVDRGELGELLGRVETYVLGGDERVDAELLERASVLRTLSFVGAGIGAFVDIEAASARGIRLGATPGVGTQAVVEHTLGLLLSTTRRLFAHNDAVKRGGAAPGSTIEIGARKIGVFGMGAIGQSISRLLVAGFGARIWYQNRTRRPELEAELGLVYASLEQLFTTCDTVLVLVATAPETTGVIGRDLLESGPRGKVLVNTAGAAIVRADDLRAALGNGAVAAAAFDGYWREPLPAVPEDPFGLLGLPDHQFVVTPHVAAKTPQTWERMLDQAIDNALV